MTNAGDFQGQSVVESNDCYIDKSAIQSSDFSSTAIQVADAIFEIALPRSASDSLPKTDPGVLLAVADR